MTKIRTLTRNVFHGYFTAPEGGKYPMVLVATTSEVIPTGKTDWELRYEEDVTIWNGTGEVELTGSGGTLHERGLEEFVRDSAGTFRAWQSGAHTGRRPVANGHTLKSVKALAADSIQAGDYVSLKGGKARTIDRGKLLDGDRKWVEVAGVAASDAERGASLIIYTGN